MSKRAKPAEVVAVRVAHERAWAYDRWLERLSWPQMRYAAGLPPEQGGLGYDLSHQALKGLVEQARADAGNLSMGREERIERQLIEVDARARAARRDLDAAYGRLRKLDEQIADYNVDMYGPEILVSLVNQRNGIARELELAEKRLDLAQDREAKVAGLYAALQLEAKVVHTDAVTEELNAMLARAGAPPIESVKS